MGVHNDDEMMALAARLALRGVGAAEPNPTVGCVIAHADGRIVGMGHHRVFGGPHAEVEAIRNANVRGLETRGAAAWLALQPCCHTAKTPPCTDALIEAGVSGVVVARRDPHDLASGGIEVLRAARIDVRVREKRDLAWWSSEPFCYRLRTGLPWVVAKWAQTLDGAVATRAGDSKWISGTASRRRVHAIRGRVDAILTGVGTVLADDPALTVRGVPARRTPARVVLDPELGTPLDSQLVRTSGDAPVHVYTSRENAESRGGELRDRGVRVVGVPSSARGVSIEACLRDLHAEAGVSTAMIEAGPRLLGSAFEEKVVNEAAVFVAPMLLGDEGARSAVAGMVREKISEATALRLWRVRRLGEDTLMRFTVDTGR